ncbi:hypothetical protein I4641_11380 [Waterburya agarophytonicola K14]|uniref:Uncharacterized protein n=1 Tax=Waterburya agarophytonicola KI4 TaxID=2874699 RepID=A0A964FFB2_9CYAN|nr:hypothetical protein [Waterburya agarophytonicola]MCC0177580.1 hypothetical protein [Waterburya agarophytonicola KI4]
MFQQGKNIRFFIDRIKEVYRDHPRMRSVDSLKEQLKQEKVQDKIFSQSIKDKKVTQQ